jgi:predicted metal-binding membrane protein
MRLSRKIRTAIGLVILGISLLVWVLLLVNPGHMTVAHCHVSDMGPSAASLQMLLMMNPISSLLTGWGLMVVAMMFPKLILPIQYIYGRSLKSRRFWSALLFVFGYVGVWMAAGVFMISIILGLNLLMPKSYIPAIVVGAIALVWQFSPLKQRCLNRGHDHRTLSAFGWAANRDALLFGVIHGMWCVGSGWALMLFPMLLPEGHNFAMVFVTFVMLSEHLEHPRLPRWRIYFTGKLMRIVFAQTQIRLKRVLALN